MPTEHHILEVLHCWCHAFFFFFFKPIFSTLEDFIGIKYHMYESIIFLVLDLNNDIGTFHYAFSH